MREIIWGALFGLLIGIGCLPGLLHDAKVYCQPGKVMLVCVDKP